MTLGALSAIRAIVAVHSTCNRTHLLAAMTEGHWRGSLCPWRLLDHDPRRLHA